MPPEATATPDIPQPISESPSTAIESPAPESAPSTPEPAPAPAEATLAPETAQIPPNEPLPPESEPIETAPEPPQTAAPAQTGILHTARDLLTKARVSIQDRKRKKRDRIMQALATKTKITNDEVEKLLHVSDATATRYLTALEKEGRIIQVGKKGKGVLYIKTP